MNGSTQARGPLLVVIVVLAAAAAGVWLLVPGPVRGPAEGAPALDPAAPRPGPAAAPMAGPAPAPEYHAAGVLPPDSSLLTRTEAPARAVVRGQVTWTDRIDFSAGAEIVLEPQDPGAGDLVPLRTSVYPHDPRFRFAEVPFGAWKVTLRSPGFQEFSLLLTLDERHADQHILLPLLPANHLKGRVLREDGAPVAGMTVTASPVYDDPVRVVVPVTGVTDERGEFDVTGILPGLYRVHAGPPRNPLGLVREVQLLGSEGWADLTVPVTGRARVRVVDAENGEPLPGIRIVAESAGRAYSGDSDGKGRVLFPHLLPGDWAFTVFGRNRRRAVRRAVVFPEQATELEIRVAALDAGPR